MVVAIDKLEFGQVLERQQNIEKKSTLKFQYMSKRLPQKKRVVVAIDKLESGQVPRRQQDIEKKSTHFSTPENDYP